MAKQAEPRALSKTGSNWVAAVETGMGITITSIIFYNQIPVPSLKRAFSFLLACHPCLRSLIVKEVKVFVFRTLEEVFAHLTETVLTSKADEEDALWLAIREGELNAGFSKEYPVAVLQPKLFLLPHVCSFLVLCVLVAAADMASTLIMLREIVMSLRERDAPESGDKVLPALEDAVPPGHARKPFRAYGVDVISYRLALWRHAYLPFEDIESTRTLKLIRAGLSAAATSLLLKNSVRLCRILSIEECEKREVSVYGVTIAALQKRRAVVAAVYLEETKAAKRRSGEPAYAHWVAMVSAEEGWEQRRLWANYITFPSSKITQAPRIRTPAHKLHHIVVDTSSCLRP